MRCSSASMGPDWSTLTGCTATVSRTALSLGTFMTKLSEYTNRLMAKRGWDSSTESDLSPNHPGLNITRRTMAGKLRWLWRLLRHLMTPTFPLLTLFQTGPPRMTSRHRSEPRPGFLLHGVPLAPAVQPFPSDRQRPTVSLPRFAAQDFACYDFALFDLDDYWTLMSDSPVSNVVSDMG